jgi:starch-binding outer membrane protein, SusD/RagB family
VFWESSPETIFYLEAPPPYFGLSEAVATVIFPPTTLPAYLARQELLDAFERNDRRKAAWIGDRTYGWEQLFFPATYKGRTSPREGYLMLRLVELYLIRAETRIQGGDLLEGRDNLNAARVRVGPVPY